MTGQTRDGTRTKSQDLMEEAIEQRVSRARQEEMLEIYQDLLQAIWNRILPTLGRVTVMAIVERSLVISKGKYPLLVHLKVTGDGLFFDTLREQVGEADHEILRDALKELVVNIIDILAMLTGDILVRQLIKEIEGK